MMTGTRALAHPWGLWAGGASEAFDQSDVRAFGKLSRWGDARVHYLVRLVDGAELFVNASKQSKDAERFLRRLAKPIRGWVPGRGEGFRTVWGEELE